MRRSSAKEPERLTRKSRINPKLAAAGWRVVSSDPSQPLSAFDRCAIEEYPTDYGPADYTFLHIWW